MAGMISSVYRRELNIENLYNDYFINYEMQSSNEYIAFDVRKRKVKR